MGLVATIELRETSGGKTADVVGEGRLGQADQSVAVDAGWVFEPHFGTDLHLGGQPVLLAEDRRTNDG
jgi:hypothetical protein